MDNFDHNCISAPSMLPNSNNHNRPFLSRDKGFFMFSWIIFSGLLVLQQPTFTSILTNNRTYLHWSRSLKKDAPNDVVGGLVPSSCSEDAQKYNVFLQKLQELQKFHIH